MVILRTFQNRDVDAVLELTNRYASFDGSTSEADLAVTADFPEGFWVAEDRGEIVGFAYGYFRDVPDQVLERWRATKVGLVALTAVEPRTQEEGDWGSAASKTPGSLQGSRCRHGSA